MSKEEVRKILWDAGIEISTKNNLSQVGGIKPLLEILKKGKFYSRFEELFGSYKARTIMQSLLGVWAGARTMVEIGQAGKDPLIKKIVGSVIEEAQLSRDYKAFTHEELEKFHDFNISQALFDLSGRVPQNETLYFDIDATAVEKFGHQQGG